MVPLGRLSFHVIPAPEQEIHLILLFPKLIVFLRHSGQVPEKKIDEEDHIRLVNGLAGGGLDQGTVDGDLELQGG